MNDWQVKQIVLAIRAHARAMVAERLWAQAEAGTDVNHVVADADALLAALSASSPTPRFYPHFKCPECGPCVDADEDGCCATCGRDCVVVERPSASSGGENDAASGEVRGTREEIEQATSAVAHGDTDLEAPCGRAKAQDFSAGMALPNDRDDSREPRAHSQAATPPLSADLVAVRRDDLAWVVAVLSMHGECSTRWNRLRDVMGR